MPARVQAQDAEILRHELNCNMVRCSHYPQSEDFYDACDELGLMVWEEVPGWDYFGDAAWQAAAHRDLHDMIIRDRNHPSSSCGARMPNEAGEHVAAVRPCTNELAHSLDDSRPTGGDGSATDASFVFDVFSSHDYSSRHRSRRAAGSRPWHPPSTRPASRTWSARRSARCPGRPALPAHRHPGRPAGPGDRARDRARHRRLRRPLLRPARLGRVRLPVRQRQRVPGHEVRRRGRRVPDPQARCRDLPGASRTRASPRSSRPRSTGTSARRRRSPAWAAR